MKKVAAVAVVVALLAVLAKRLGSTCEGIDWEKRFEHMPDNAPPKWIFRNVSAIRGNTERIIKLLEDDPSRAADADAAGD